MNHTKFTLFPHIDIVFRSLYYATEAPGCLRALAAVAKSIFSLMDDLKVKVYINGDMNRVAEVDYHPQMQYRDFLASCREKLHLRSHAKCRIFDSTGDEYSDDDMELLDPNEPLFLSQGEDFQKTASLAVYEEVRPLGEGGFGTVKLYRHRLTGEEVAIKFVEMKSMESFEDVNRVFAEMNVLRSLRHPHIVALLETFNLPDKLCIVMEFCRGGELKNLVDTEGPLSEDRAYSIAIQICEAMRFCHNSSVVHRDLKMENLLFADSMQLMIKVVDFGIAGAFRVGGHSETSDAGSLLYTAPEVINGSDTRSLPALDIWSMGCIFYYMVAGKHPFESGSAEEAVASILAGRFAPLPASVSKPWGFIIRGMLQTRRDRRWDMLHIEAHLQKHRDTSEPCADCLYNLEEEKKPAEERKVAKDSSTTALKTNPVKSKSFRTPASVKQSAASPVKGRPKEIRPKPTTSKTTRPK